jgi:hypothetical protein
LFTNYKLLGICLCIAITHPLSAWAETPKVSFDGFANVGLTYSNNDNILYRSSILNKGRDGLSILPDTWVGLQTSIKFNEKMDAVGQVILQDRWDDNISNYIELMFLRYQFNRNTYAKIGRFSTSGYLFTDSRYISQSYAWARAPIDQYSAVGAVGNMNGLQFGWVDDTSVGLLKGTIAIGNNEFNNDRETPFNFTYDKLISANLELSTLDWRVQIAHLRAKVDDLVFSGIETIGALDSLFPNVLKPFAIQIQNSILGDNNRLEYSSIGIQYTFDVLELIAEYGEFDSNWAFASSTSFSYVSALYPVQNYTFFVNIGETDRKQASSLLDYDFAQSNLPPSLFEFLVEATAPINNFVRSNAYDQQSIGIGLRWDAGINWSIKAQFDHYRISEFGSGFFTLPNGAIAPDSFQTMNVFNVSFSTTF